MSPAFGPEPMRTLTFRRTGDVSAVMSRGSRMEAS